MADAQDSGMAAPLVETRSTFKKPAAPQAKPAAAPPSSDATYSRVVKRPSRKRRLVSTETPQDEAVPKRTNKGAFRAWLDLREAATGAVWVDCARVYMI